MKKKIRLNKLYTISKIILKHMLFRKYLAFVESTFPWFWVCVLTWWADRLFVEIGHRNKNHTICTHSEIQYVQIHQYMTAMATILQIIYSIRKRITQFKREAQIMGIDNIPSIIPIILFSTIICIAWCIILTCLLDLSPWLCIDYILNHRATIAFSAMCILTCTIPLESKVWDRQLQRALRIGGHAIDI